MIQALRLQGQRHFDSGGKSDASPMRQGLIFSYIFHIILQSYRL